MARIDVPRLKDLETTLFNQIEIDTPEAALISLLESFTHPRGMSRLGRVPEERQLPESTERHVSARKHHSSTFEA